MNTPSKPTCFTIGLENGNMYYASKEMLAYNPEFYYGCKAKPRTIIQRKKIPEREYLYATLRTNEWKMSNEKCRKAQLLISKDWVEKYYFKPEPATPIENEDDEKGDPQIIPEKVENKEVVENIEKAPPILHLKEEEKFRDSDGNVLEIETRGERHEDKIYFKAKDVSVAFDLPSLNKNIIDKERGSERNVDYKTFIRPHSKESNKKCESRHKKCKTTLYLTYEGLLRVLFVSRNKNASTFRKWATNKLFTIQMGSNEEKIKLGTDILNISVKTYKAVFDTYASKFPCIYLLSLGTVKDLRETFGLDGTVPDESNVYKFGFTDDLERRLGEHQTKYGKMKNVHINLACFHIVDVKYTSEAESEIRDFFNVFSKSLDIKGYNELVAFTSREYKQITRQYKSIGEQYTGNTAGFKKEISDLNNKIKDLHDEMKDQNNKFILDKKDLSHVIELKDRDMEAKDRDMEANRRIYELEIMHRDMQIKLLKNGLEIN
jgi:hypothetical protein